MAPIIRGNRHHVMHSCQSGVSDWAARGNSYTSPVARTAATIPWIYPLWGGVALTTYLGPTYIPSLEPITHLPISRYPSDIAIESDYLAF
eukprot:1146640-Pleurochrysis_carterae.AAC.1